MAGFRAYLENLKDLRAGDSAFLSAAESRHLCGALRAQKGDMVDVFDLSKYYCRAEIICASAKKTEIKILEKREVCDSRPPVILAQCLPKTGAFDSIISSAIQLGATAIFPLFSERCVVKFEGAAEAGRKLEKWRVHVIEAVKQSSNFFALNIFPPQKFADFLAGANSLLPEKCARIVASLEAENPKPLLSLLECQNAGGACVLIGPEGDMSKSEYAAAHAAGFAPATLGENVMKCEVAAGYAVSVCRAYFSKKAAGQGEQK
ncbi:MAG: 16S rRNA (uracil(1498)-N(3))-methyltransferase [Opitutales bacterium]|nr:16S rRNA (uracil(1498)-N(3))-methyltransferase [Opitutales bacterium]